MFADFRRNPAMQTSGAIFKKWRVQKKSGLTIFPLDTQWDDKIKALLSIHGNDGLSWIITFWATRIS